MLSSLGHERSMAASLSVHLQIFNKQGDGGGVTAELLLIPFRAPVTKLP